MPSFFDTKNRKQPSTGSRAAERAPSPGEAIGPTGKPVWTFHTVPLPGEYGYETWPPDAYKWNGGANTWSNFSIDEKRGIAYFPTGSPTYDYYGGRRKGENL